MPVFLSTRRRYYQRSAPIPLSRVGALPMALRLQLAEAEYDRRREDVPRNQLRMDIAASYVANRGRVGLCWIIAYAKCENDLSNRAKSACQPCTNDCL